MSRFKKRSKLFKNSDCNKCGCLNLNEADCSRGNIVLDFEMVTDIIRIFISNHLEESRNPNDELMLIYIQECCYEFYPFLRCCSERIFLRSLLNGLLDENVQFMYRREGEKSYFFGLKLMDFEAYAKECVVDLSFGSGYEWSTPYNESDYRNLMLRSGGKISLSDEDIKRLTSVEEDEETQ